MSKFKEQKKKFLSRHNDLQPHELTRDELQNYIAKKLRSIDNFYEIIDQLEAHVMIAKREVEKRPRSRKYTPGIYWDNTPMACDVFTDDPRWISGRGGLIIVDYDGHPWSYSGCENDDGWWRFGKSMNNTSERVWERIGDL